MLLLISFKSNSLFKNVSSHLFKKLFQALPSTVDNAPSSGFPCRFAYGYCWSILLDKGFLSI